MEVGILGRKGAGGMEPGRWRRDVGEGQPKLSMYENVVGNPATLYDNKESNKQK